MKKSSLIFLFLLTSISFGQYNWSTQTIKTLEAVNFWTFTCTAAAPSGNVYAAYFVNASNNNQNRTIEVQKWNGTAWSLYTSFTASTAGLANFSDDLSIAVDNNEHLHMTFQGYTGSGVTSNRGVSYGFFNGTSWSFTQIEYHSDPNGWKNCDDPIIKVTNSNNPVILFKYSDANTHYNYLKAAIKNGSWNTTIVQQGSDNLYSTNLLLKSDGTPIVIYGKKVGSNQDLVVETYNASSWNETVVATVPDIMGGLCAAINSSDHIYFTYEHWIEASATDKLVLYNNAGGTWVSEDLFSSTTVYCYVYSLLFSGGNNLVMEYTTQNPTTYDYDNLKFMLKENSHWVTYTMPVNPEMDNVGLTVDDHKNLLFVYGNNLDSRPRTLSYTLATYTDPMPVEMNSFSARMSEDAVVLSWNTATEVNNYGFEIERKQQSQDWQKVGFIEGHGNSNSQKSYTFIDKSLAGGKLYYRLKQVDNDGSYKYYDEISVTVDLPKEFKLMQNRPNPFNPETAIKFQIPVKSFVSIRIYDLLGKEVMTLLNEEKPSGSHIVYWNGKNNNGVTVPSGMYLYRLSAGNFVETKKMNFVK
ncbi:MAG: T9SS type A sorting domain-containing protein [Ignavibacteriales bacterium]